MKTIPFTATHTHVAYIHVREYVPSPGAIYSLCCLEIIIHVLITCMSSTDWFLTVLQQHVDVVAGCFFSVDVVWLLKNLMLWKVWFKGLFNWAIQLIKVVYDWDKKFWLLQLWRGNLTIAQWVLMDVQLSRWMTSSYFLPQSNWRAKHEEFISNLRAARGVTAAQKTGGPLPPPPPPAANPDYVQCPHCSRRFNEHAAERHIPFCKEQKSRLANTSSAKSESLAKRKQVHAVQIYQ